MKPGGNNKQPKEKFNIEVLEKSFNMVQDSLEGHQYDGYEWIVGSIDPTNQDIRFPKKNTVTPQFSDHEELAQWYRKKPTKYRQVANNEDEKKYLEDARYYSSHSDIRSHSLYFSRCFEKNCIRCTRHHEKNPLPPDFDKKLGLPNKKENNALWFTLEEDPKFPGHFKTYKQLVEDLEENPQKKYQPDEELPLKPHSRCLVWYIVLVTLIKFQF